MKHHHLYIHIWQISKINESQQEIVFVPKNLTTKAKILVETSQIS